MAKITVKANPLPGHQQRWRAGRPWPAEPVTLTVADDAAPASTVQRSHGAWDATTYNFSTITPADVAELKSDPLISVSDAADDEASDGD